GSPGNRADWDSAAPAAKPPSSADPHGWYTGSTRTETPPRLSAPPRSRNPYVDLGGSIASVAFRRRVSTQDPNAPVPERRLPNQRVDSGSGLAVRRAGVPVLIHPSEESDEPHHGAAHGRTRRAPWR